MAGLYKKSGSHDEEASEENATYLPKKLSTAPFHSLSESHIREQSFKQGFDFGSSAFIPKYIKKNSRCSIDSFDENSTRSGLSSISSKSKKKRFRRKKKNLKSQIEKTILSQLQQNPNQASDDEFSIASNMTSEDILHDLSDVEDEVIQRKESASIKRSNPLKGRQIRLNTPAPLNIESVSNDEVPDAKGNQNNQTDHLEDLVNILSKRRQTTTDSNQKVEKDPIFPNKEKSVPNKSKINITSEGSDDIESHRFFFPKENWDFDNFEIDYDFDDPFNIDQQNNSPESTNRTHISSPGTLWENNVHHELSSNVMNYVIQTGPQNVSPSFETNRCVKDGELRIEDDKNQTMSNKTDDGAKAKNILGAGKHESNTEERVVYESFISYSSCEDGSMKQLKTPKLGVSFKSLLQRYQPLQNTDFGEKKISSKSTKKKQIKPFHKKTISQPLLTSSLPSPHSGWETFGSDLLPWRSETFESQGGDHTNDPLNKSKEKFTQSKYSSKTDTETNNADKSGTPFVSSGSKSSQQFSYSTPSSKDSLQQEDGNSTFIPKVLFLDEPSMCSEPTVVKMDLSPNDVTSFKYETRNRNDSLHKKY